MTDNLGTATATYAYDDADRRTSVTLPTGAQIQYAYNSASELTTLTYRQGTTTLGTLTYTYDAAGNRTKQGGTYARSNIPPALSVVSYNANNQQTTFGANTLTYDLNGNLTTVTDNLGTATYTWNARNQLTGITGTSFTASFSYDSFGRRTTKTINGFTTKYLHDGLNVVQEQNGTGGITANFLTGLGIDEILTRTDSVGARGFLSDALGTTIALVDNTGIVQTTYTYEPFGSVNRAGQASQNAFKYTGREDDATGLYYYRARYYHPRLQRFISEDPIGFGGKDWNLYQYTGSNPIKYTDPTGLETYRCRRPLRGDPGANQRNGPDICGNPFYHQYSCTRDPNGRLVCGGQGFSGANFLSTAGKPTSPEKDYFSSDSCRESEGNNSCFEQCLQYEWMQPRPRYGIPFGTDCQEYDNDVNARCRKVCGLK
ncbi:MAG: RHS repeat-associated core domain-containing protein [Nitrospiraceae bacterium]